jgi:hypothetical protein
VSVIGRASCDRSITRRISAKVFRFVVSRFAVGDVISTVGVFIPSIRWSTLRIPVIKASLFGTSIAPHMMESESS